MPAGRPTGYNEVTLNKAKKYLDDAVSSALSESGGLPSIAELALHLDVSRDTLYEWSKVHEEFSYILSKLLTAQEMKLLDNGLSGKWNSTITKLMLTKHGYSDKVETDVTSKGESISGLSSEEKNKLLGLINDKESIT